jgi:ribosome maturation factor RimP
MPAPQAMRSRIVALIEPVVTTAGYYLEDVAVNQAGRRTVVRVVVDADGGITLDDVAAVSRQVSAALDQADGAAFGAAPYTLEVTSPGVDRPLTEPRHWRRNVGRLVTVRVSGRGVTVRIVEVDDEGVRLADEKGIQSVAYAELGSGRVQVEFDRPATKPGKTDDPADAAETIEQREGGDQ